MAEPPRSCWGCGKEPPVGIKFQRCMRCAEQKLPSSYFCGEACMLANWPRHKAWHKEQKDFAAALDRDFEDAGKTRDQQAELLAALQIAEATGDERYQLLVNAVSCELSDPQSAARTFRKLIKAHPEWAEPYYHLAGVLIVVNRPEEAATMFAKAMDLCQDHGQDDTVFWASSAVGAFSIFCQCRDAPKPEWWNDHDLKSISARIVAVRPDDMQACWMRAHVLSPNVVLEQPWNAEPRTAEEIKEAAEWYRQASRSLSAATRVPSDEDIERFATEHAAECDRVAGLMIAETESKATREAASARAAEEAMVAREAAEAKAAAAAEELLAEEEQEKQQAGTKAGKAKQSKGKKGKGKR